MLHASCSQTSVVDCSAALAVTYSTHLAARAAAHYDDQMCATWSAALAVAYSTSPLHCGCYCTHHCTALAAAHSNPFSSSRSKQTAAYIAGGDVASTPLYIWMRFSASSAHLHMLLMLPHTSSSWCRCSRCCPCCCSAAGIGPVPCINVTVPPIHQHAHQEAGPIHCQCFKQRVRKAAPCVQDRVSSHEYNAQRNEPGNANRFHAAHKEDLQDCLCAAAVDGTEAGWNRQHATSEGEKGNQTPKVGKDCQNLSVLWVSVHP
mmetsp:Transcript_12552/g.34278  ORF Transcript_12552/g.34278 Transcript_12552/m.34278 type:complete len:261 (+) Transcript_12552:1198-1980(+)